MKKLKKSRKGKDLPRYKAIGAYERSFKRAYSRILGEGLAELSLRMREIVNR